MDGRYWSLLLGAVAVLLLFAGGAGAENTPPTAIIDAIVPAPAYDTQTVAFEGHGDDSDGNVTAWQWVSSLDGNLSEQASFERRGLSVGNHSITFRVRDDNGTWSANATRNLTVLFNEPPVATIDAIAPEPAYDTQNVTFRGHGNDSDSDENITEWQWRSDRDGLLSLDPEFTLSRLSVGNHSLTFRVRDDREAWSANATANLTVLHNEPPRVVSLNLSATELYREQNLTLFINGSDDRTDAENLSLRLEYSLSGWGDEYLTNLTWTNDSWRATFAPPLNATPGTYTFRARFEDPMEGVGTWTYASAEVLNHQPEAVIQFVDPTGLNPGEPLQLVGTGSDDDGDIAGYRWRSSRDGVLSGSAAVTLTNLSSGGHVLYFAARDNDGDWSPEATTRVTVNHPPLAVIELVSPSPAYDTQAVTFRGNSSDRDGAVVAWQWHSSRDGNLSEIPEFRLGGLSPGNHTLTFRVRDDNLTWSANATFPLLVDHNQLPVATSLVANASAVLRGRNLSFTFNASDDNTTAANLTLEIEYLLPDYQFQSRNFGGDYYSPYTVMSADGEYYAITRGDDRDEVFFFSTGNETPLWSYKPGGRNLLVEAISEDGRYFIVKKYYSYEHNWVLLFTKDYPEPIMNFSVDGIISKTAMSRNGEYFALSTWLTNSSTNETNRMLYLFHRQSSTLLWKYTLVSGAATDSIAISANGSYIALGINRSIILFSKYNATPIWIHDLWNRRIRSIAFSRDTDYFVACGSNTKLYLFRTNSSTPVWTYSDGWGSCNYKKVAISANGKYVVYISNNGISAYSYLHLIDGNYGTLIWSFRDDRTFDRVAISDEGDYIAAGAANYGSTYFFTNNNNIPVWTETPGTGGYGAFTLSGDGSTLLTASRLFQRWSDGLIGEASLRDGRWQATFAPSAATSLGEYAFRVRFRDDHGGVGPWLYTNATVEVQNNQPVAYIDSIDPSPGYATQTFRFAGHGEDYEGGVSGYEWRSDRDGVLGTSATFERKGLSAGNHTLSFRVRDTSADWSPFVSVNLTVYSNFPPVIINLTLSALEIYRGRNVTLYLNGSDDLDAGANLTVELQHTLPRLNPPVWQYTGAGEVDLIALSRDGRWMAVAARNGRLYLVDRENGYIQWTHLFDPGSNATALAISADGKRIAAGTDNRRLYAFGRGSQSPLWSYALGGDATALSLSADGAYLAAGDGGRDLSLFDAAAGELLWSNITWGFVTDVALAGDYLVASSSGPRVYFFHRDSPSPLWTNDTSRQVTTVALSADGTRVAVGDVDGGVYLFDRDGVLLWSHPGEAEINDVAVSRDGLFIIAGSAGGTLRYFGADSGTPLWNHTAAGPVHAVAIADDGSLVAAAVGAGENATLLLDGNTGAVLWSDAAAGPVLAVALSGDGEFTASGSADRTVRYYRRWHARYDTGSVYEEGAWRTGFAPSYGAPYGNYTLRVRLRDTMGGVGDWYHLGLTVLNNPPTARIDAFPASLAIQGQDLVFAGHGEDLEGGFAYRWRSDRDGLLSTNATFNTTTLSPGNHTLYFAVQDADGEWSPELDRTLFVNLRPVASIAGDTSVFVHSGQTALLNGSASDADGEVMEYNWSSDLDGDLGSDAILRLTNLSVGDHNLTFAVRDDLGAWSLPVGWTLRVNARPVATNLTVEPRVVLRGANVTFNVTADDSDGNVTRYRFAFGDLIIEFNVTERANFSTAAVGSGNYTVTFQAGDDEGGWSDPLVDWFYVNAPPVARIESLSVERSADSVTVNLTGMGTDDETIVAYQWRSDRDGDLGVTAAGSITLTDLGEGPHNFSLRVQDRWGAWSEWVTWSEPVEVRTLAAGGQGGEVAGSQGWVGPAVVVLLALVLVLGSAAASWQYYSRIYLTHLKPTRVRLRSLARHCELAGMDYPRDRFEQVEQGLTFWNYHTMQDEVAELEAEVLKALNFYVEAGRLLAQAREVAGRADAAGLEYDRARLEEAERVFGERQWEQARWAAAAFTEKLSKRLEAGAGERSQGVESAGARDAAEDEAEDAVEDEAEDAVEDEAEDEVAAEVEATAKVGERGSGEAVDEPPADSETVNEPGEVPGEEHEGQ